MSLSIVILKILIKIYFLTTFFFLGTLPIGGQKVVFFFFSRKLFPTLPFGLNNKFYFYRQNLCERRYYVKEINTIIDININILPQDITLPLDI